MVFGERKSFGYKGKSSFGDKPKSFSKGRSERPSRDGERKSFGYKGKSSFGDKPKSFSKGRSERPSRDGERKSFGYKGKSSLEINQNLLVKEDPKDHQEIGSSFTKRFLFISKFSFFIIWSFSFSAIS